MKKVFNLYTIAFFAIAVAGSGCKKQLDINNTPNQSTTAGPELLLPSAEVELASAMGVDMQINGSMWAQYWTQSPTASQYRSIEQYQPGASNFDRVWALFYNAALQDLKQMQEIARVQNKPQYVAAGKILSAYIYQVITDAWGDIPFAQAQLGAPEDGLVLSPKYDQQEAIYDGLLQMVDSGLALVNTTGAGKPGSEDLLFGGNMGKWQRFGNTLKLKMLLRLSAIKPAKAAAGIAALAGLPFMGTGDDAIVKFIATSGNRNPLSAEIQGYNYTQNIIASSTSIDTLLANKDPRIAMFYDKYADQFNNEFYAGLPQGNYNTSPSTPFSLPHGALTGADATNDIAGSRTAPVKFFTSYESYLLQAEAAARGWLTGADDAALFNAGINASFAVLGFTAANATDYMSTSYWGQYPSAGTTEQKIRHIITQKWMCMNGTQGFEAWTEWRRTGYPDFFVVSKASLIGNKFPRSFFYPASENTRNSNFPGQRLITDKVWWDIH